MTDEQLLDEVMQVINDETSDYVLTTNEDVRRAARTIIYLVRRHDAGAVIMELPLPPGYQTLPHGVNYTHPMRINL